MLLLALLVLVLLTLLIGQMSLTGAHNRSVADNAFGSLQAEFAARAGYHQAMLRLEFDLEKSPQTDHLQETWSQMIGFGLGDASVQVRIVDAERKFNLSALLNEKGEEVPEAVEQLQRLIQVLGHEPVEPARRILDYVDADTKGDYEAGAKNAALLNLDELHRIEGLKREVLMGDDARKGLLPFLTLWPNPSQPPPRAVVNPNTAPIEVLQSLDEEMTLAAAQSIVTWRQGLDGDGKPQAYTKPDDLKNAAAVPAELAARIAPMLVFAASAFEVHVTASVQVVQRRQLYVVGKGGQGNQAKFTLITSQVENDFLSLPPPPEDK